MKSANWPKGKENWKESRKTLRGYNRQKVMSRGRCWLLLPLIPADGSVLTGAPEWQSNICAGGPEAEVLVNILRVCHSESNVHLCRKWGRQLGKQIGCLEVRLGCCWKQEGPCLVTQTLSSATPKLTRLVDKNSVIINVRVTQHDIHSVFFNMLMLKTKGFLLFLILACVWFWCQLFFWSHISV